MKNKGTSEITATFIITALELLAIGVFCYAIDNVLNLTPDFKITKEECWNETVHYCSGVDLEMDAESPICFFGVSEKRCESKEVDEIVIKNINDVDYRGYQYSVINFENYIKNHCSSWTIHYGDNKEIYVATKEDIPKYCSQWEKNQNILYFYSGNSCVIFDKEINGTWSGWISCDDFEKIQKEYSLLYKYSKSDLTTEWLDENCECFIKVDGQTGEDIYGDCDYYPETFAKETSAETIIKGTNQYKCGDYIVEIK